MKINRGLANDKVWHLYVLCGVCSFNFDVLYLEFWEVGTWSFVVISNRHNAFVVMGSHQGLW
jgi:hypothetical protein